MAKTGSLLFPFEEDLNAGSLKRAEKVNQVLKSAMACFLLTTPGQRRGNPIGSFLPELKHRLLPQESLKGLADELKKELTNQFPGVTFLDVTLTKDISEQLSDLIVTIQFGTAISDLDELSIVI